MPLLEPDCKFSVLCIIELQLKRLPTIFLTFLILVSSAGTTVAFHYCGKSLQDVNVFGKAKSCCGGVEMQGGCCHDEKVEIASDEYQLIPQITNTGFIPALISELAFPILDFTSQFETIQTSHLFYQNISNPPADPEIILFTQSFLI